LPPFSQEMSTTKRSIDTYVQYKGWSESLFAGMTSYILHPCNHRQISIFYVYEKKEICF
jgi:hypothetical protein